MQRRHLIAAAVSGSLFLTACGKGADKPAAAAAAKPAATAVNVADIEAKAKGFTLGSTMSVRTVYVFFDAQCPHCAALWKAAKPLKPQAKFIWIPVRILNDSSASQGAALLSAKDPAAAMDEHEASMAAKGGGISGMGATDEAKSQVAKNTELFNSFGFGSIPSIVAVNATSGALVSREGAMPTAELAAFLGLQAPAQ